MQLPPSYVAHQRDWITLLQWATFIDAYKVLFIPLLPSKTKEMVFQILNRTILTQNKAFKSGMVPALGAYLWGGGDNGASFIWLNNVRNVVPPFISRTHNNCAITKRTINQILESYCSHMDPSCLKIQGGRSWLSSPLSPAKTEIRHQLSTNMQDHQIALIPRTQRNHLYHVQFPTVYISRTIKINVNVQFKLFYDPMCHTYLNDIVTYLACQCLRQSTFNMRIICCLVTL